MKMLSSTKHKWISGSTACITYDIFVYTGIGKRVISTICSKTKDFSMSDVIFAARRYAFAVFAVISCPSVCVFICRNSWRVQTVAVELCKCLVESVRPSRWWSRPARCVGLLTDGLAVSLASVAETLTQRQQIQYTSIVACSKLHTWGPIYKIS